MWQALLTAALAFLSMISPAWGAARTDASHAGGWTARDSVAAALDHAPNLRSEKEKVRMQQQNVRQAKAGHLPRVDVEASGGAATLPVSRHD